MSRPFSVILVTFIGALAFLPLIASKKPYGFRYGEEKVRGVSLGGWLIIENFMTPSLFDNTNDNRIIDEWTFCQYQDKKVARYALEKHWSTFITKEDFRQIRAAGLNHVRLPIGYWAFDVYPGDVYIPGQLPYLLKAVDWAEEYELKIMLVIYGAPGSQNGNDDSGRVLDVPGWQTNQTNIDHTTHLVKRLVSMFKKKAHVVPVIGVLNEPAAPPAPVVKQFYKDSYENVRYPHGRNASETNLVMMMNSARMGGDYWKGFLPISEYNGVILDRFVYHQAFFHDHAALKDEQLIENACKNASIIATSPLPAIIGEWTSAITDCAKGVNGRNKGARYDGTFPGSKYIGSCEDFTGDASTFSEQYKTFLGQYWEAQTQAYERGGLGWTMWSWKFEDADDWSYQKGLKYGWIPQNPAKGRWPDICKGRW